MNNLTKPTEEFDQKVIARFLEKNPEWNDTNEYSIRVISSLAPKLVTGVCNALVSGKFSGRHGSISDVGGVLLFKILIESKTLPSTVSNRIVESKDYKVNNFQSVADVADVVDWLKSIKKIVSDDRKKRAVVDTKAGLLFRSLLSPNDIREIPFSLSVPASMSQDNAADKRFYRMWARDSKGTLYMKSNEGYVLVPKYESGSGGISVRQDPEFWSLFWEAHKSMIDIIEQKVVNDIWEAWASSKDAESNNADLPLFLNRARVHIPVVLADYLSIVATVESTEDEEGNTQRFIRSFQLKIRPNGKDGESTESISSKNWQTAIGKAACAIDPKKLVEIKTLSNNIDEPALFNVPIERFVPSEQLTQVPDLPPSWKKFFETKLGSNFSSQLYRIAKWTVSCLDQWNVNRNVLIIAGHGNDGKSMFTDVMIKGFNNLAGRDSFATTLPADAVQSGNTQNGLLECMSSRVLVSPDVSKITSWLNTQVIKNITGGDEVTAEVKYRSAVKRKMTGVKVMATTNYPVYLSDDHSISRTYPIVFKRSDNSPNWDAYQMKLRMLEEFEEWIKWCFAFAYATDDSINISHRNPAEIFSDTVPEDVPFGSKEHWEAIGTEDGSEPMFRFRATDEQGELDDESISFVLEGCTVINGKVLNMNLRSVLIEKAESMHNRGLAKLLGEAAGQKALTRAIRALYPEAKPFISHGKRGWEGFSIKTESPDPRRESRRPSAVSTVMPAGL